MCRKLGVAIAVITTDNKTVLGATPGTQGTSASLKSFVLQSSYHFP